MATVVDVHSTSGGEAGRIELDQDMFGIEPNIAVLHQVVVAQRAAGRQGTQSTKTRSEVRGGGAKPFKQKGTGRARQGSERAPQFTGGGIALGPKPRSYRQRTPRKMIALALRSALSDRAKEGRVAVVESWSFEEPSTKAALKALGRIGVEGRILVVLDRDDEVAAKSFRNIPEVQVLLAGELNAYDILINDWVVFTRATLPGSSSHTGALAADSTKPTSTSAATKATSTPAGTEEDDK